MVSHHPELIIYDSYLWLISMALFAVDTYSMPSKGWLVPKTWSRVVGFIFLWNIKSSPKLMANAKRGAAPTGTAPLLYNRYFLLLHTQLGNLTCCLHHENATVKGGVATCLYGCDALAHNIKDFEVALG